MNIPDRFLAFTPGSLLRAELVYHRRRWWHRRAWAIRVTIDAVPLSVTDEFELRMPAGGYAEVTVEGRRRFTM